MPVIPFSNNRLLTVFYFYSQLHGADRRKNIHFVRFLESVEDLNASGDAL